MIGAHGSPRAPLQRVNPVAKLLAALVLMVALFVSLDAVTASIILVPLLALTTVSGVPRSVLIGRGWLIALLAISVGLFNVLFAAEQLGPTVATIGPVEIGAETLANGVGLALRLIAIFLAGTLATATSDPTEVADALIQQARVSPRFAIGVLAALRLVPVLAREWRTIGLARRARGVEAGRSPVAAVRLLSGRLMALLVAAIRRASRMAVAHGRPRVRGERVPHDRAASADARRGPWMDRGRDRVERRGHRDEHRHRDLAAASGVSSGVSEGGRRCPGMARARSGDARRRCTASGRMARGEASPGAPSR